MKVRRFAYYSGWITAAWAALGVALPTGIVLQTRKLDAQSASAEATVQQMIDSVLTRGDWEPEVAAVGTSAADSTIGVHDRGQDSIAQRVNGAVTGAIPNIHANRAGMSAAQGQGEDRVRQAASYRVVPPGSLAAVAAVSEPQSSGTASHATEQSRSSTTTIRLQDEELPAGSEGASGVSLRTIGLGVLAAGGITAATLAIIEATDDPASP